MRWETFGKKESWQPAPTDWVCSICFADGLEADENPIRTLFLGYENKEIKSRRKLFRKPCEGRRFLSRRGSNPEDNFYEWKFRH